MRIRPPISPLLLTLLLTAPLQGKEVEIDSATSTFAVVTHKAGLGARFAHDHLVVADQVSTHLTFDPATPLATRFECEVEAQALVVDRADLRERLYPALEKLEVLSEPFTAIGESDRGKIRAAMLGEQQLAAAAHPQIKVRLLAVKESASSHGLVTFPYHLDLAFTAGGQTARTGAAARFEVEGDRIRIEALGTLRFTDLNIKPYSALFGAVKNADEFHLYLYLEGQLSPAHPTPSQH